eukprot:994867-Rhodomonas_salina.2
MLDVGTIALHLSKVRSNGFLDRKFPRGLAAAAQVLGSSVGRLGECEALVAAVSENLPSKAVRKHR